MKEIKICNECLNCIPIGEGDHTCDNFPGSLVLEDYAPGEDFMICGGRQFEEK